MNDKTRNALVQAVSCRPSQLRPGFNLGGVYVEFLVDIVLVGQIFLRQLQFYPVGIIPSGLYLVFSSYLCTGTTISNKQQQRGPPYTGY